MEFDVLNKILHRQASPARETDGTEARLRGSRTGALFTVNWKQDLVMQGLVYRVSVGTITGGGDVAPVTGGGNGTTVDQDQPEIAIGVDAGYFLIPLEVKVSAHVDIDADADDGDIIVAVDRTAGVPTSVTGTTVTPANQLDGGAAFPGRAFSAITADITDPTVDEILDAEHIQAALFADTTASNSSLAALLKLNYVPEVPNLIAGPCGLYVYWGGVAAVPGVASVLMAAVPSNYFA